MRKDEESRLKGSARVAHSKARASYEAVYLSGLNLYERPSATSQRFAISGVSNERNEKENETERDGERERELCQVGYRK